MQITRKRLFFDQLQQQLIEFIFILNGHLYGQLAARFYHGNQLLEQLFVAIHPLQSSIAEDQIPLLARGQDLFDADMPEGKAAQGIGSRLFQHGWRGIDAQHACFPKVPGQYGRLLSGAAAQIDNGFWIILLE